MQVPSKHEKKRHTSVQDFTSVADNCFTTRAECSVPVMQAVPRSNLQLISVACMLVASKHEEECQLSVQDFISISDNCFTTRAECSVPVMQAVPRSNLQLISVACMLVASKHGIEHHLSVQGFTGIADSCATPSVDCM